MTKAEAKRYVWRGMAATLDNDLHDLGAMWLNETDDRDSLSKADVERVHAAAEEVIDFMRRKGQGGARGRGRPARAPSPEKDEP